VGRHDNSKETSGFNNYASDCFVNFFWFIFLRLPVILFENFKNSPIEKTTNLSIKAGCYRERECRKVCGMSFAFYYLLVRVTLPRLFMGEHV